MSRLLYYLLIKPLSLLPLRILYLLSDLVFALLFHLVGYRKKIVFTNLERSFPDKTPAEISEIARRFYHHFCDLMFESIRIFSISEAEAQRRCKVLNPEIFAPYAAQGKSIITVGGHYANWEMAALAFENQITHHVVGIYSPLKDAFMDQKIQSSRTRYGTGLANRREVPQYFERTKNDLNVTFFIGDQSPSSSTIKQYWTTFLHQETGVVLGAEKYAKQYDLPVFYVRLRKVKRGHYEALFVLVEDHPTTAPAYSITEKHLRMLEAEIRREPAFWLWTHRRWKHQRPSTEALN